MKRNLKLYFILLSILIIIFSCPVVSDNEDEKEDKKENLNNNIISSWEGTYTGGVSEGIISAFILYDDNSLAATWQSSDNVLDQGNRMKFFL
jgi:hypothetical protein